MPLRRTLFGLFAGILGVGGLISACATSAELGDDDDDNNAPLEAGTGEEPKKDSGGNATPPKNSSSSSSSSSGGSSGGSSSGGSSGSSSGGSSGWIDGPNEGEPCDVASREYTRSCGLCGKQTAKCLTDENGTLSVSAYTECAGEVVDGCGPNDAPQTDIPCGYCGTQTRTCNNSCKWVSSACTGQVTIPEKCMPGTTQISGDGCAASTYRTWTCNGPEAGATKCQWNIPAPSTCAAPVFPSVNVPGTVNTQTSFDVTTAAQSPRSRPESCSGTASLADRISYIAEIRNTTGVAVKVDVFIQPKRPTGADRELFIYKNAPPMDDELTKACQHESDDCGLTDPSYLTDAESCSRGVTIPIGGKIWAMVSNYAPSSATVTPTAFKMVVRRVAN